MISAGDFRNGVTIEFEGNIYQIIEFQHVKPGKGAAFVRVKMKNVVTGAVTETSFNPTAKFEEAFVERREMQYLYNEGDLYYFMDQETFEQIPLTLDQVEDAIRFMKEETMATVRFFKGKAFSVEAPNFVVLEVTDTEPGSTGDTTSNTTKPATLETGYQISVPLFINTGDKIRVDTRTREYYERIK